MFKLGLTIYLIALAVLMVGLLIYWLVDTLLTIKEFINRQKKYAPRKPPVTKEIVKQYHMVRNTFINGLDFVWKAFLVFGFILLLTMFTGYGIYTFVIQCLH